MGDTNIESFTAAGRPFSVANATRPRQSGLEAMSNAESFGFGAPNLLPVRFHDDSIISIPVLRPEDIQNAAGSNTNDAPTNDSKGRKLSFFHRKSTGGRFGGPKEKFAMREVTRRDYLAHYAKDSEGKYAGTEWPAEDCILRGEDLVRYRQQKKEFGVGVDGFKNEFTSGAAQVEDKDASGKGFIKGFRGGKGRGDDTVIR